MKDETVVGAHTFTYDVSSLMLRLKGHQTSLSNNIKAPESLSVDAHAPLNHSVEALALCSVNTQAPDNSVDAVALASPVHAPSSAPFQRSVEANEIFAPARSVDAHAPSDFPVDANSAPLHGSVDATSPRKYAPSTDIVESNVYDNNSNNGEFDWGFVNCGVHFARRQI